VTPLSFVARGVGGRRTRRRSPVTEQGVPGRDGCHCVPSGEEDVRALNVASPLGTFLQQDCWLILNSVYNTFRALCGLVSEPGNWTSSVLGSSSWPNLHEVWTCLGANEGGMLFCQARYTVPVTGGGKHYIVVCLVMANVQKHRSTGVLGGHTFNDTLSFVSSCTQFGNYSPGRGAFLFCIGGEGGSNSASAITSIYHRHEQLSYVSILQGSE
jgi:hypothetical protein